VAQKARRFVTESCRNVVGIAPAGILGRIPIGTAKEH